MKKINPSDRLPDKGVNVFIMTKSGSKTTGTINNGSKQESEYWKKAFEYWIDESEDSKNQTTY